MHTASHALSMLTVRREGLQWSKETTASATAVLDTYGKHVGELDHLIQPVALRVQVGTRSATALPCFPDASASCAHHPLGRLAVLSRVRGVPGVRRCVPVPSTSAGVATVQALTVASEKIKAARSWADSTLQYLDTTRQVRHAGLDCDNMLQIRFMNACNTLKLLL
jgi:hypothetical protein